MDDLDKARKEEAARERRKELLRKKKMLEDMRARSGGTDGGMSAASSSLDDSEGSTPLYTPREVLPQSAASASSGHSDERKPTDFLASLLGEGQAGVIVDKREERRIRMQRLTMQVARTMTDRPPDRRYNETYDRGTQTESVEPLAAAAAAAAAAASAAGGGVKASPASSAAAAAADGGSASSAESVPRIMTPTAKRAEDAPPPPLRELTAEEIAGIVSREDFVHFLSTRSKAVERALAQGQLDIFKDYTAGDGSSSAANAQQRIWQVSQFSDESRLTRHRAITSLCWSHKFPELFLASYHSRNNAPANALTSDRGVVLLWSTNLPTAPEFTFTCQTPVSVASFLPHDEHLVVGGTYTGHIALWDMRAKSDPVAQTPLSTQGHTRPICGLSAISSANKPQLVSVSNNGRLCVWDLGSLTAPQDTIDLSLLRDVAEARPGTRDSVKQDVAPMTLELSPVEVSSFYIGSEDGAVYTGALFGQNRGVFDRFEGHFGPVTSSQCHPPPSHGNADLSHIMLTCGMDWTCKLWDLKRSTPLLYTFEHFQDYVYDARWSPVHPGVFAAGDGTGTLTLWNLNEDTEVPYASIQIGDKAINRLRWSHDGRRLAVGDSQGVVTVLEVTADLHEKVSADDWQTMEEKLDFFRSSD